MRRLITVMITMTLILAVNTAYAQFQKQKKWKVGLNRFNAGISYKYDTDRYDTSSSTTAETEASENSAGTIAATTVMMERIFLGLFGVELDIGITSGRRNYTFETTSKDDEKTKIGDIVETTKPTYLYGANWYFKDHSSPGWKIFFGVLTGVFSVTHEYSNGGERDDDEDDTLTAFRSTQTSSKNVPVQVLKLGVDWIRESVGIRFEYLMIDGIYQTSAALPKTRNSQNQHETVTLTGGLSLGVFAHF